MMEPLQVYYANATPTGAEVCARLPRPEGLSAPRLQGSVEGPLCEMARTLTATYPLRPSDPTGGDDKSHLQARARVTDPCFWKPGAPYRYRLRVELIDGDATLEVAHREIGVRPLAAGKGRLRMESKNWALRGIDRESAGQSPIDDWIEWGAAMVVRHPDRELLETASRRGLLLVVVVAGTEKPTRTELHALSQWPAVAVALLLDDDLHTDIRMAAPNVLLAAWEHQAPWADLRFASDDGIEETAAGSNPQQPLVALREPLRQGSIAELRAECDRLQRDTAGRVDLAGYVICPRSLLERG